MSSRLRTYKSLRLDDARRPSNNLPHTILARCDGGYPFTATENQELYDELTNRSFRTCRSLRVPEAFDRYGKELLARMGWQALANVPETYYPVLVRLFYANMVTFPGQNVPCSFVKGTSLALDIMTIANALQVAPGGEHIYIREKESVVPHIRMELNEYYATFCTSSIIVGQLHAKQIKPEFRLLRHFITNTILPRKGHTEQIEPMMGFIIHCVAVNRPLCFPYIMQQHMLLAKAATKTERSLPYAALLTSVFHMNHVAVDEFDEVKQTEGPIDARSVSLLQGFPPKETNTAEEAGPSTTRRMSTSDVPRPRARVQNPDPIDALRMEIAELRHDTFSRIDQLENSMGRKVKKENKSLFKRLTSFWKKNNPDWVADSGSGTPSYESGASGSRSTRNFNTPSSSGFDD